MDGISKLAHVQEKTVFSTFHNNPTLKFGVHFNMIFSELKPECRPRTTAYINIYINTYINWECDKHTNTHIVVAELMDGSVLSDIVYWKLCLSVM